MAERILHEQFKDFVDVLPGVSVSRQWQSANVVLPPHWHERMEIWRVVEGQFEIVCDREAFTARQGHIVVFNPFEVHSCMVPVDSIIDCYIVDTGQLAGQRGDEVKQLLSQMCSGEIRFCHLIEDQSRLWPLLDEILMLREHTQEESVLSLSLLGLIYLVFARLCEQYIFVRREHSRHPKNDELSIILNYIHSEYQKRLTLDDLSSRLCFTKAYFCRWFKSKIGESPIDYLNTVRVRRAYELLCNTELSVTEICYQTGFADVNCFNRQFKKRMSVAPSHVRRGHSK